MRIASREEPHVPRPRQHVRTEESNSNAKAKVGSQAGGEIEETEGRDEKGSKKARSCRHSGVAHHGVGKPQLRPFPPKSGCAESAEALER
jgi:hypothetical protein